jgi:hypothetical protein
MIAMSGLLFVVVMTMPVLVGIAVGHLALHAILGALETAVVKQEARLHLLAGSHGSARTFGENAREDEQVELAA